MTGAIHSSRVTRERTHTRSAGGVGGVHGLGRGRSSLTLRQIYTCRADRVTEARETNYSTVVTSVPNVRTALAVSRVCTLQAESETTGETCRGVS